MKVGGSLREVKKRISEDPRQRIDFFGSVTIFSSVSRYEFGFDATRITFTKIQVLPSVKRF